MIDLTKKGYTVARNVTMVTREEWKGWWIPLPTIMSDAEIVEYLHECSNEMCGFVLSLQAIQQMVKNEVAQ